jgi:hypothetical protein
MIYKKDYTWQDVGDDANGKKLSQSEKEAIAKRWNENNTVLETDDINNSYKKFRQAEYPPIEDYLDAIVKGDEVQKQKYIDDCKAVKEKYAKGINHVEKEGLE